MSSIPSSFRPIELAGELEDQMLRWGRDASSPHGNLLERHGFRRFRTAGHVGSSRYRLRWRDRLIELHSSCITFCGGGRPGLRYVRSRRRVYLCSAPEPPPPGDAFDDRLILPSRPEDLASFRSAAGELRLWLEAYASWRARAFASLAAVRSGTPESGSAILRWFRNLRCESTPTASRSAGHVNRVPAAAGQPML